MHTFRFGMLFSSFIQAIAGRAVSSVFERDDSFTNPIIWEDYPDIDVFRVGDVFYYSSSTFAFSPGAPVLKSYDLVNWAPVSHSVPRLEFGDHYNLNNSTDRAYVKGIWASTMRYRESDDKFYWIGCIEFGKTYVYTSPGNDAAKNDGEVSSWDWEKSAVIDKCYYDCGLLIDDDDTMYVAYGNTEIHVAQLSSDGLSEVRNEQVYSGGNSYIEGAHMYKFNGYYWIVPTKVASGEWVLRSTSPWGPYEQRVFWDYLSGPIPNAGFAHQGGMVDTRSGDWYYVAFMDAFPTGRIPVVAPIAWNEDGWPGIVLDNGTWGTSYPIPVQTDKSVSAIAETDTFEGPSLGAHWEWNHNPDNSKWGFSDGLVLQAASVTDDLYTARNTLTRRVIGPKSVATFHFDIEGMTNGDRAGAAMFRDQSAYIGVHKSENSTNIVVVNDINLSSDGTWTTESKGTVVATGPAVTGSHLWLRIEADVSPALSQDPVRETLFSYSTDGESWTRLGPALLANNNWTFFMGYRYAAFNFATSALGGQVALKSFTVETA